MLRYIPALFGAILLLKAVSFVLARRRQRAEAVRRGCGQSPTLPKRDPTGLTTLIDSIRANKQGRGPKFIMEALESLGPGVHTARAQILDYELFVTRDPENIKAVLGKQASDFDTGVFRGKNFEPLLGKGIFTSQGEAWKHSRGMVRQQFSREQISDLDLEERHVQAILNVLKVGEDGWTKLPDLEPLFFRFTLDTITEFLYGYSVHSQNPAARSTLPVIEGVESPDQDQFNHHIDQGKAWIEARGALFKFYWLLSSSAFRRHCREVKKLANWYVQDLLRRRTQYGQPAESFDAGAEKRKSKFFLLEDLASRCDDPIVLRNETLNILIAGRDTTGALLGWVFYFLARNPAVYDKLRATILADFGPGGTNDDITFEKLKSCHYLQYTIREVHRVATVVPLNERVSLCDTTLPRGGGPDKSQPIFIPKGTQVLIASYALHHRRDLWGDDVEDFKPERWDGAKLTWEYAPFGGGPRMCLGRKSCPPFSLASFFPRAAPDVPTEVAAPDLFFFRRTIFNHRDGLPHRSLPSAI